MDLTQRAFLASLGLAVCLVVAGCATPLSEPESNELSCEFNHQIVDDRSRVDTIEQNYTYENLSLRAKNVFNSTLEANGTTYRVENQSRIAPAEFEYTDTFTYYEIERGEESHVLITWTSEGCSA